MTVIRGTFVALASALGLAALALYVLLSEAAATEAAQAHEIGDDTAAIEFYARSSLAVSLAMLAAAFVAWKWHVVRRRFRRGH